MAASEKISIMRSPFILIDTNPRISLADIFFTFLGENANIFLKPIDCCRSTKLPFDTNFQLSGTRTLSN